MVRCAGHCAVADLHRAVYRRVFDMQDAEMKKLQRLAEMAGRRDDRAALHRFDDMARRAMAEKREGRRE